MSADLALASGVGLLGAATKLRALPTGTPDVLQGGRAMLFMMLASLSLVPSVVIGAISFGITVALTSFNVTAGLFGAAVAVAFCQPAVWLLTGQLFDRRELD